MSPPAPAGAADDRGGAADPSVVDRVPGVVFRSTGNRRVKGSGVPGMVCCSGNGCPWSGDVPGYAEDSMNEQKDMLDSCCTLRAF